MKKLKIYAYVNFNLGDDLFVKVLCNRYPNTKFILHAPKEYKKTFKKIKNLKVRSSDSYIYRGINFILRRLNISYRYNDLIARKYDAFVHIGGSIYMQRENWRQTLREKQKLKMKNKPFFVLGANFGPYQDEEFYLKYKELFKEYTDICFRDKYSFNLFNELNNVRLADDVIFQLKEENQSIKKKSNSIVISVIKPSIRKHLVGFDEIYYNKIKDIAIYFIEKKYNVTLMSFCGNEGDMEAVSEIMAIIPKKHLNKLDKYLYRNDIEAALHTIEISDFVVGTRFHAMILGWVYNKPVFPIAYSEKMTNVMKDINFDGSYTDFNDLHKLEAEDVFNSMFTNRIDVSTQIINAERQFKKTDEYLQSK